MLYNSSFPICQEVGPIDVKSNDQTKFDSTKPPFIISHFTDTHVNTYNSTFENNFIKCLNSSLLYQSEVFLHTGDAVDDFCTNKRPKYGDQCSNDFTNFNRIISKYQPNFKYMLGNSGNHNMFGIYSFDSTKFNYLKTAREFYDTHSKSYSEFLVSIFKVSQGDTTVNFVSFESFQIPNGPSSIHVLCAHMARFS